MGVLPTRHAPELGQRATAWVQGKASLALSSPLSRENTVGSQGAQQPAFESGKGQHCSHGWECSGRPAAAAKSLQSCPPLCDPIDSSPLGSSVPGILQARILEWVATSFSNA